jgi:hypothetical protein
MTFESQRCNVGDVPHFAFAAENLELGRTLLLPDAQS